MRGVRAWLLAGVVLLALGPARLAEAQQASTSRQVTVQNETDQKLDHLYLSPPAAAERGPDRLGDAALAPGSNFRLRLNREAGCSFDVVAVWQDGREESRSAVNICRTPRLVFGDPAMPRRDAAITNRAEVALRQLYASPNGPESWGPNRLGDQGLAPAGSFPLRLRSRDCVFDLRAVYADAREEVRNRHDLCAEPAIAFDRSTLPRPVAHALVLVNRHLEVVQEVYVSASMDADWGPDRLAEPLPVGEEATVTLEAACQADVRIVFPNGGAEERRELDLCTTPRLLLAPGWVLGAEAPVAAAAGVDPASADPEAAEAPVLKLRNAGTLPIIEIYAAPPGEPRGEDRLGADVLGVGESLELEAPDGDACIADLVALFRDGREVTRSGVDLCQGEEIEIR